MALTFQQFEHAIRMCAVQPSHLKFAVAVSGGPDSMALVFLLSDFAKRHQKEIYAYTVDHGLRRESKEEALQVHEWCSNLPFVQHKILPWVGDKPDTRVLEEARKARYQLLMNAAKNDGCRHLFVAHHRDDQAETFLIRLAKGSGLDGLAGMKSVQRLDDIDLLRPLLDFSKHDLIDVCIENKMPFVKDPTNENDKYMRPRLRAAQAVLEKEGLTSKRLAVTAKRMARARHALEQLTDVLFENALIEKRDNYFLFDWTILNNQPQELIFRLILKSIDALNPDTEYGPRMEKVEFLLDRIMDDASFNGATLSGCAFYKSQKKNTLKIERE